MRSVLDFIVTLLPDYFLVGLCAQWAVAPLDWNLIRQSGHPPVRKRGGFLLTEWLRAAQR
jgi:hypothetical protein